MLRVNIIFVAVISFFTFFFLIIRFQDHKPDVSVSLQSDDRVVISAPILLLLYGADRYLAANLETIRLAATGHNQFDEADTHYLIRAQQVVAQLNPCHEDNYYLANGLLTWGGAVDEANRILLQASQCRFWDGMPSFFYGVNRVFFDKDKDAAISAFEVSAARWPENRAALQKLAIVLRSEKFADERLAVKYLETQRDATSDSSLQKMLDQRVQRLSGLINLRQAQRKYESKFGALKALEQLVEKGVIKALPEDPLRLGYELKNGQIELKKLRIAGMEN